MAPTPDRILVHDAFVRGIARAILGGGAEVDDVVQETWIRALESPPRETGSLRAWLRVVVRNLSLSARRRKIRRATREAEGAAREPVDPADEIVACEEIRGRLFRAVMSLDEDYRTALVLRFYQGLPPRKISARLGIPVETVKTRLKRGVAKLRAELDAEDPANRGRWLGALVILTDPERRPSPDGVASLARLAGLVACGLLICVGIAPGRDPGANRGMSEDADETAPALVAVAAPPVVAVGEAPLAIDPVPVPVSQATLELPIAPAVPREGAAHPAPAPRPVQPGLGAATVSTEEDGRVESVGLVFRSVIGRTGPAASVHTGEASDLEQIELVLEGDLAPDVSFELRFEGCAGGMAREPVVREDGRAQVVLWLRPGHYSVGGTDPEVWVDPAEFDVGPGEPTVVVLRVSRPVAVFFLRPEEHRRPVHHLDGGHLIVRRSNGAPSVRRRIGPDGVATFRGLPPGEYVVRFAWPVGETVFVGTAGTGPGRARFEYLVPTEAE